MNLYVLSDLHAEFVDFMPDPAALKAADVVVLAGDIHDGETASSWIRSKFGDKPIIWVAGNHEFYGHHWDRCVWDMQRISEHYGIHFLEDQSVTLGGVDFLGCTLWTDFELLGPGMKDESIRWSQKVLADYRHVAGCTPETTIDRHRISRAWLAEQLSLPSPRPRVVVTHHYPSPRSTDPQFEELPESAAFGSDLPPEFFAPAALWIHGHTHTSFDYVEQGCRVICNPRGYPRRGGTFENPHFNPGLLVSV